MGIITLLIGAGLIFLSLFLVGPFDPSAGTFTWIIGFLMIVLGGSLAVDALPRRKPTQTTVSGDFRLNER